LDIDGEAVGVEVTGLVLGENVLVGEFVPHRIGCTTNRFKVQNLLLKAV
jgi:hypothetical protein